MGQVVATVFLMLIIAGVTKMVIDVQIAKLERTIEDLKKHFDEN
jgi:ribosomal protein S15P/S13E